MTYTIIDTGADRQQWMATRRGGISATDIARLATGGAAVKAAIKAEKAGHERHFETRATLHGIEREPILAQFAADSYGMAHNRAVLAALDEPRFRATPDLLGRHEVGDIKTTVHDWNSWSDVPKRYVVQLLWQMRVTGDRQARLVYEPHEGYVPIYPLPRSLVLDYDENRVAELEEMALEFLDWDGEPDPDAQELDALATAWAEEQELAQQAARAVEARRLQIEQLLGGPRKFNGSVANITRSADTTSRRHDGARFKKEHPDLAEEYTKATAVKGRLTITMVGGGDDE